MEKYLLISWIDLVIVSALIIGMVRGQKRGISEELLDMCKWVLIILAGAVLHRPLGDFLASFTPFNHLTCYLMVYSLILIGLLILFSSIKAAVGEKVAGSDAFGDGEYYLGIFAGGFRYFCVILVIMTYVNARAYQPHEANAQVQSQLNNFGMVFFTVPLFQEEMFKKSFVGRQIVTYLQPVMIQPTASQHKALGNKTRAVRARESIYNEILD